MSALSAVSALSALSALGTLASVDSAIWVPVIVFFFTLAPVTAPFLSCSVPTLLAGSLIAA